MTKEQELLLALVRLAIHPKDEGLKVLASEAIIWEKVLDEAEKQSLIGVAFFGLSVLNSREKIKGSSSLISKSLFSRWFMLSEKIKEDNLHANSRTAQVCRNIIKDGHRLSVMKGQGNALLYGKDLSLLRTSGDIDVWMEGGFQRVFNYAMKIAPTNQVSEKDIVFDVFSDIEVELHYCPLIMRNPLRNRKLQAFFNSQAEACFGNQVELKTIGKEGEDTTMGAIITTTSFNLVHQLAHIHRHMFAVGMGLRHVMDYYYQLVHAENVLTQAQKDDVIRVVKSIGLEKLAKSLTWILSEYFGLPSTCQLWEPNQEDGDLLLNDILSTGNFGSGDKSLLVGIRTGGFGTLINVIKHNLALSRFDRTDWFWGPFYRIYFFFWRKVHGFTH